MDQQLSYKLSLDIVDLKKKAKEAQAEIDRIEKEILDLNKLKVELVDPKDKELAKQVRQEIERLNNSLKEQRLVLRSVNEATKEKAAALRAATTAEKAATSAVEKSIAQESKAVAEKRKMLAAVSAIETANKATIRSYFEQKKALDALPVVLDKVSNSTRGLTKAQQQLRSQAGASNGVFLEFNRIIQDAPFGIIGIGNNIQQLGTNFSQLQATAKASGTTMAASLASIVTPANLVLLGISALTSLWTAYQLGVFDSAEATRDLAKELDEFRESLDGVNRARIEGAANGEKEAQSFRLLKAQAESVKIPMQDRLEAVRQLRREFPDYFKNLTNEQILTGKVGDAYKNLANEIIATAKARAFSDTIGENQLKLLTLDKQRLENQKEFSELNRKLAEAQKEQIDAGARVAGQFTASRNDAAEIEGKINETFREGVEISTQINTLKTENRALTDEINKSIKEGARLTDESKNSVTNLNDEVKKVAVSWQDAEDAILDAMRAQRNFDEQTDPARQFKKATDGLTGEEGEDQLANSVQATQNAIAMALEQLGVPVEEVADEYEAQAQRIAMINQTINDSFGAMATAIAASFKIQNDAVKGFVTTLASNLPKIISAIVKTAAANKKASDDGVESSKKGALANGIFMATESGKSLGAIGLALLPVLIGGAMALINSAFSKSGAGGGSSGVSSAVGTNTTGSTFTGSGLGFTGFGDFDMTSVIKGTDIVLSIKRTEKANA